MRDFAYVPDQNSLSMYDFWGSYKLGQLLQFPTEGAELVGAIQRECALSAYVYYFIASSPYFQPGPCCRLSVLVNNGF